MKKNYCIIGTGRQGTAAAYDLLKYADIHHLLLLDCDQNSISNCLKKIQPVILDNNITSSVVDFDNQGDLIKKLEDIDIFLSSVPYVYNLMLTKIALESSTSMVDLGGHTGNVIKQLDYDKKAKGKDITIVPDCGMGPGMNVTMALLAMEHFDTPQEVRIWDGGLPKYPKEPWNYSLFFNINGLTNEYDENAFFLKDGKINEVACFENYEIIDFGSKIGKLEASVTSGGLSTMPFTYKNDLQVLENKTLRYLGHWEWMKAYRQLGLFSEKKVTFKGQLISPREFYHYLLEPQLDTKDFNDICIMRVEGIGLISGKKSKIIIDAIEEYDDETKLMAMEKWTGWHASIMMQHIIKGNLGSGAFPIEKALTGHDFIEETKKRNYNISINIKEIH
jgi:lysine 6-dehydrogenase